MGVLTDARKQHLYQTCQDAECQRFACRVYKEGYMNGKLAGRAEGHAEGRAEGYSEGHSAGYSEGYSAGAGSCGDG
jgi:flagellar biosynthesis/type III secretory pathway protein FliH